MAERHLIISVATELSVEAMKKHKRAPKQGLQHRNAPFPFFPPFNDLGGRHLARWPPPHPEVDNIGFAYPRHGIFEQSANGSGE
jgi:hypothetical protein